jgi:hypothetical protein
MYVQTMIASGVRALHSYALKVQRAINSATRRLRICAAFAFIRRKLIE